jgi:hypothetical protein
MGLKGDAICTLGRQTLFLFQRELNLILKEYGREYFSVLGRRRVATTRV